ncbi:MAG: DUF5050 domain-containing protein [Lachnospiraceae bacterium]|nr:DUF5050 domain-containing protein [Lachnospiraceae bacterium]
MKKHIPLLVFSAFVLILAGVGIFNHFQSKIKYNDNFVNGNSAGNLYNAGLFCESDGTVFFANPDDKYRLYSMDLNGDNLKKICDDTVMYINADSHYVYYVRNNENNSADFGFFSFANNSLCRITRTGKDLTLLDPDPCIYATLIGNYVYYLHYDTEHATTLYKVGIDGEDRQKVYDPYIFTCSALGQYFYSNGTETDGALYQYDTTTDQMSKIYDCNCYKPIVTSDNNVYYLDVDQNNALVHTNIQSDNPLTLVTDSIDLYNVYGSTIFYQRYSEDNPALCMIKNDGSGYKELASGNYSNINVTSHYIYFTDFKSGQVYCTPTDNPGELTLFHPGAVEDK